MSLTGHLNKVIDIAFHPEACSTLNKDGPNIATASSDNTVRLWTFDPNLSK